MTQESPLKIYGIFLRQDIVLHFSTKFTPQLVKSRFVTSEIGGSKRYAFSEQRSGLKRCSNLPRYFCHLPDRSKNTHAFRQAHRAFARKAISKQIGFAVADKLFHKH